MITFTFVIKTFQGLYVSPAVVRASLEPICLMLVQVFSFIKIIVKYLDIPTVMTDRGDC